MTQIKIYIYKCSYWGDKPSYFVFEKEMTRARETMLSCEFEAVRFLPRGYGLSQEGRITDSEGKQYILNPPATGRWALQWDQATDKCTRLELPDIKDFQIQSLEPNPWTVSLGVKPDEHPHLID